MIHIQFKGAQNPKIHNIQTIKEIKKIILQKIHKDTIYQNTRK